MTPFTRGGIWTQPAKTVHIRGFTPAEGPDVIGRDGFIPPHTSPHTPSSYQRFHTCRRPRRHHTASGRDCHTSPHLPTHTQRVHTRGSTPAEGPDVIAEPLVGIVERRRLKAPVRAASTRQTSAGSTELSQMEVSSGSSERDRVCQWLRDFRCCCCCCCCCCFAFIPTC